jgi:hypothetical protein
VLTLATTTKSDIRGGAALTYVAQKGVFTFELPLLLGSKWTAQTKTAKWCVPAGAVSFGTGRAIQTAAAQTCDEQALGAPTQVAEMWTAALFGGVDKPDGRWRISVGPTFAYRFDSGSNGQIRVGGTVPVYFNLGSFGKEYAGDYKVLARVLPTVELVHDATGTTPQASVALQLLGARNLFGRALDWP